MSNILKSVSQKYLLSGYMAFDPSSQLDILRENIRRLLPPDENQERLIVLTSSTLSKAELTRQGELLKAAFAEQVRDSSSYPYSFLTAESINSSAELIVLASKADGCIIYEQEGRSIIPQIDRQVALLKDQALNILGFVYLYETL